MKFFNNTCFIFLLLGTAIGYCQQTRDTSETIDSLYREDQFYLGFTYNLLTNMHPEISESGFSGGLHAGFIRDFPINKRRNLAFGAGLGLSYNNYGQNLFIGQESSTGESIFRVLDSEVINYDKNRFSTQSIEIPLQVRWRTSTAESHKFWRVYTGLRLGYVYSFRSNFRQPENVVRQTIVPEFNRTRLGATFDFGYNTFNFFFYYSLNPFFGKNATIDGTPVEMNTLKIGLMFYIL